MKPHEMIYFQTEDGIETLYTVLCTTQYEQHTYALLRPETQNDSTDDDYTIILVEESDGKEPRYTAIKDEAICSALYRIFSYEAWTNIDVDDADVELVDLTLERYDKKIFRTFRFSLMHRLKKESFYFWDLLQYHGKKYIAVTSTNELDNEGAMGFLRVDATQAGDDIFYGEAEEVCLEALYDIWFKRFQKRLQYAVSAAPDET